MYYRAQGRRHTSGAHGGRLQHGATAEAGFEKVGHGQHSIKLQKRKDVHICPRLHCSASTYGDAFVRCVLTRSWVWLRWAFFGLVQFIARAVPGVPLGYGVIFAPMGCGVTVLSPSTGALRLQPRSSAMSIICCEMLANLTPLFMAALRKRA